MHPRRNRHCSFNSSQLLTKSSHVLITNFIPFFFISSCSRRSDARREEQVRTHVQTRSGAKASNHATTTVGHPGLAGVDRWRRRYRAARVGRCLGATAGHRLPPAVLQHAHQAGNPNTPGLLSMMGLLGAGPFMRGPARSIQSIETDRSFLFPKKLRFNRCFLFLFLFFITTYAVRCLAIPQRFYRPGRCVFLIP